MADPPASSLSAAPREVAQLWLLLGLGNPGPEYDWTPHNAGFQVLEELARRCGARLKTKERQALTGRGLINDRPVWLAEPQTYMNLSGHAARALLGKEALARLLVICDDTELPLGMLRIRERGSAGSHNGLESVVEQLQTQEFARLRVGVGPTPANMDRVRFVLQPWPKAQREKVMEVINTAADAVEVIVGEDIGRAMNRFNVRPE